MGAKSYQDLIAWQKAVDLVEAVYRVTQGWPKDELYGLTNQVRRAAVSVPANMAEGQGRDSSREFLHHLSIANGSLYEVETHLLIARRLRYIDAVTYDALIGQASEIGRLTRGLMKRLKQTDAVPAKLTSDL